MVNLKKKILDNIENSDLKELTQSISKAARHQYKYSIEMNKSKRAELLFGENAGKKYRIKAQTRFQKRRTNLLHAKYSLENFLKKLNEEEKTRAERYFKGDEYKKFIKYSENTTKLRLLKANMTPDNTKIGINQLNSTIAILDRFNSLDEATKYLDEHLSELIETKMHNPGPNPFCVLGLVITSIYVVLVILAALICAITLGFVCEGVLDKLIEQACSS